MSITIELDDDLLRQAKERAAARGLSVDYIIEEALRQGLARGAEPVDLPVSNAGHLLVDLDWTSNSAIADFLDEHECKSQT